MTKHSWLSGDFRGRAAVRLCVALAAGIAAGVMAPVALASPHPIHYSESREAMAHHGRARRVQAAPDANAPKSSKQGSKSGKGSAKSKTGATADHATKRRKPRPQEADNDPLVLHRAKGKASQQEVSRRSVVGRRVENASRVVAEVSAEPRRRTPVGRATLRERFHEASSRARNSLSARHVRPSVLPEDHADRVAVIDEALQPMAMPVLYNRGRLIVPPPLKGSRDILVHQNTMADSEGLDRIQDDDELDRLRDLHLLVALNDSAALYVNEELPENRRYARPWAVHFATDMSHAFYAQFHQPLRLSSAVRTVEYQLRLQRVNGNAAAVDGDGASPHLTGQALDFGKHGMSRVEIAWMRAYLAPLIRTGAIDVEEEFQQSCFHISVYRSYAPLLKERQVAKAELPVASEAAQ